MQWKQPEGLRRHWVLEEWDGELLFLQMPPGAAQGRVGEEVYDLRDGGVLRKKRTLAADGTIIATLEEKAAGAGGTLQFEDREYVWKRATPSVPAGFCRIATANASSLTSLNKDWERSLVWKRRNPMSSESAPSSSSAGMSQSCNAVHSFVTS